MQNPEPLTYGSYFHIYNHGVGNRKLFCEPDNYEYFLDLYDAYISPVAETYAWCLMPNHFHLLVRMKEHAEVAATLNLTGVKQNTDCQDCVKHAEPCGYDITYVIRDLFDEYYK